MSEQGGIIFVLLFPYGVIILIGALLGTAEELWDWWKVKP